MLFNIPEVNSETQGIYDLYCLHRIFQSAFFLNEFTTPPGIKDFILPSDQAIEFLSKVNIEIDQDELSLILFGIFYYNKILIHHHNSDLDKIHRLLEDMIFKGVVKLPFACGRMLYDKFNDSFDTDRTDKLDYNLSTDLLNNTPIGIYQVGKYLTGPLGILLSHSHRYFPPSRTQELWHCSDPGCRKAHTVRLLNPINHFVEQFNLIHRELSRIYGPEKDLEFKFKINQYSYIIQFLGDCIIKNEVDSLLGSILLSKNGKTIRYTLSQCRKDKLLSQKSTEDIISNLSFEAKLQLILVLPDEEIVNQLDKCIYEKKINIPVNEVRQINKNHPLKNNDIKLSPLGIRAYEGNPFLNLAYLIWKAFEKQDMIEELNWLCDGSDSDSRQQLFDKINDIGAINSVNKFILNNKKISNFIGKEINLDIVNYKNLSDIIIKILWKIGFDVHPIDERHQNIIQTLKEFSTCIESKNIIANESDMREIRSKGVNLFVEVEHFIHEILCYNVWLISSDHFLSTRFNYIPSQAAQRVPEVLGDTITIDIDYSWNPDGNTLGTSMVYFNKLVKWLKNLYTSDREVLKRDIKDLPFYYKKDSFPYLFPFIHTQLWADSDLEELKEYISGIDYLRKKLIEANLTIVRNGLDHFREPERFPDIILMKNCIKNLKEAVDFAFKELYFPVVFWIKTRSMDISNGSLSKVIISDYNDNNKEIIIPSLVIGGEVPLNSNPIIVAPRNLINYANYKLIFSYTEESIYFNYWKDYIRRRSIEKREISDLISQIG